MSPEERQQLKGLIVASAMYYGQELADEVLALYVEDLDDLDFATVVAGIKQVRRDPKTTRFPLPAVIRERVVPAENSDDEAREASSRIIAAVARFGWPNPDRARDYIGTLGWYVVERQGGWRNVCGMLDNDNISILQAQWRDLASSAIRRAASGRLDSAPQLPASQRHALDSPTLTVHAKSVEDRRRELIQGQLESLTKEMPKGDRP